MAFTAAAALARHPAGMRKNSDFVGPRQPSLREVLAWAGVRPASENTRESNRRWQRRQNQMQRDLRAG